MADFSSFLKEGTKGHLIGIGGVSMAPLAEVLLGMGLKVRGSDSTESEKTAHLRNIGIDVRIGHSAMNLSPDAQFVIRTAAANDDNPELIEARARGIKVFERADAWGAIMRDYKNALCISGTHGKTTTTSMCTHIMIAAERDPTAMIGGTLPLLKAAHRVGSGDTIILESCEYHNSFLSFFPTVAVVLDIEEDHLDFFKDLDDVKNSFRRFAELVPPNGIIVANYDDKNTMDSIEGIDREVMTFGLSDRADVYARRIKMVGVNTEFDIYYQRKKFTTVTLHVPGMHNVKNALAAAAATICLGAGPNAIKYGLAGYGGAGRRFEFKGKFNGADVYDDYAHHPGELKVLLDAVEPLGYKRTILVFQPHTYSRTTAFFDYFISQLRRPEVLLLAEIYAARETNKTGISSADLAAKLDNSKFYKTFEDIENALRKVAGPGDIILTVGAGDVYKIGERIVE